MRGVEEDAILVEVGEKAIRVSDYRRYLARVPEAIRGEYGAEQFLQAMVEEELLVQEAERRGLGREPGFLRAMRREEGQLLQRALYERVGIVQPQVAEAELRAFFQASPYNRRVRFSLLMVRDEEQMPGILAELEQGANFEQLSMRRSQDPRILERHADMGYHRWGETMPSHVALTERAFTMESGEVFGPMQVADGHFLIKLTDVHPVSFEQERETIERLVLREKLGRQLLAYYDTLHARYQVRYERSGLEALARSLGAEESTAGLETVVASHAVGAVTLGQALELMRVLKAGQVVGEEMLRREVGRQVLVPLEVEKLGLKEDPPLQQEQVQVRRTHIVRRLQEQLQTLVPPPNANVLSLFYEENKTRYEVPTQVDVRRLLVRDEAEGRDIVERMRAGRDTTGLVDRFVEVIYGSGAIEGENRVSRALRSDEGSVHGPFATDNGYIVLQVLRRRDARLPPLIEVQERVEADWSAMQIQTAVKGLAADLRQRHAAQIRLRPDAAERLALIASGDFDSE
jgi:peptidyl-prolyl cis-trans isomerase C